MLYTAVFAFILLNIGLSSRFGTGKKTAQRWFLCSCAVVLIVMSGCRFQVGRISDMYRNYMHVYDAYYKTWKQTFDFSEEFLHQVLRKTIVSIFRDPQAYFFITAAFFVGCMFFGLNEYSADVYLGVVLYYVWEGYFASNNITRQYIAMSIGIIAIRYIIKEKPIRFFVCVLLAMGFHTSAIVMAPLYFLSKKRFGRNMLIAYALLAVVLIAFNGQIIRFTQRFLYSDYGAGYGAESSNALRLVWSAVLFFFLILIKKNEYICRPSSVRSVSDERETFIFNNLLSHGTVLYIYFSMLSAVNMLMLSRVASYYHIFALLLLTYGIGVTKSRNNMIIYKSALYLLILAWFVVMNSAGKYIPTPYTPFWEFAWRAIPR